MIPCLSPFLMGASHFLSTQFAKEFMKREREREAGCWTSPLHLH
ncbi:unnamed protein product [Musa banksii]